MEFLSLRLSGFKSFVDPTELVIAPGLTGVVGPNGCGKSNLLEALRWVMGESRSSAMRGEGMEDVIFAGAASRPARNHAEVALRLDNRDGQVPAGFNQEDRLEITRRIVRDAGSAYRANGREVRARDVAVLFADASSGAQSPSLVRQGQIAELIAARPRARRRVLEEAAGVAGLYQRRHEAELKLRAAEANLERVGDVLEALEAQRAALTRQARQAARYRTLAEALRRADALLLLRLWHDAESGRTAADASLTEVVRVAARAEAEAARTTRSREAAAQALPASREEDAVAAAIEQRAQLERERIVTERAEAARRIEALTASVTQLADDRAREAALDRDAAESAARLAEEASALERAGAGHAGSLAAAQADAADATEALASLEADADARSEAAARAVAEHHAANQALEAACIRLSRAEGDCSDATAARDEAEAGAGVAERQRAEAAAEAEAVTARAVQAEATATLTEAASTTARAASIATAATLAEAEGAARGLAAEASGLERILARPEGVAAQMLDLLQVEPGYEAALGAALGEDLALPELGSDAAETAAGWTALPPMAEAAPLPRHAEPLATRVAAPPALARRLAAVAVVSRPEGAALQAELAPGQRAVSREGDLWRWDGLRVASGAQPTAAALRLHQRNRLADVAARRATAEAALAAAGAVAAAAAEDARAAVVAETSAREERRQAEAQAARAAQALARAESAVEALDARRERLARDHDEHTQARDAARTALDQAKGTAASLPDPAEARAAVEAARLAVEGARLAMLARRAQAQELEREAESRDRRLSEIARESAGWQGRAATAVDRLTDLDRRAQTALATLADERALPSALSERLAGIDTTLEAAQVRHRAAAEALAEAEAAARSADATARGAERAAGEAREARARAEALAEAAGAGARAAQARLLSELDTAPEAVCSRYAVTPAALPAAEQLEAEAAGLRHQRDAIGAVNLRAEEDARAVADEAETLARDRKELEAAIATLRQGIAALNREGRGRLVAAFEAVNRNFGALFTHLFGGGEARLALVESDDPLDAGLEIMCQPPGKKLSTLSLLSGGEQTLTALSLIFAVFLANPSPICVLDEVDAPLDDANVARFCDLLDEMIRRTRTRFLIITHHAVTMARMDRLFGVTMVEAGVSQLVSVDLASAERLVEPAA